MNKVTQVNIEGQVYSFVAGQAIKGASGASAADYTKIVTLPEGAELVDGMLIAVLFVNGNTAGMDEPITVYSSDGETFYYDQAQTEPVTLPPSNCYTVELISGDEYSYQEFINMSVNGVVKPLCDSHGHHTGGSLWNAGDLVVIINMDNIFVTLIQGKVTVADAVEQDNPLPVSSGAVYSFEPPRAQTAGTADTATVAKRVRTAAVIAPEDGDIWLV